MGGGEGRRKGCRRRRRGAGEAVLLLVASAISLLVAVAHGFTAGTVRYAPQMGLRSLVKDAGQMVRETGLRAPARRTAQAVRAGFSTAVDLARDGELRSIAGGNSNPRALRLLFERLGATYIKVGQFIASSPSIFPAEYVREFEKCLDRTDPVPWAEIKKIIEQDLGRRLSDVYSYVNTVPLASASVAQVYEARLRTGEDCVIKVQKPGVANVLKTDLGFLYIASRAVELVNPEFANRLSLGDIVGDIRQSMLEEVDFILEAKNLDEFASFLASEGLDGTATCPMVFRQATSRKVLTMQRLRGVPLTNLEAIREVSQDPEGTLISALNVWNLSVMRAPFFHADVHAGNLLVLEDGRIGFIDFGIVGRMGAVTFEGISILADALVTEDFAGMARGLVTMGATLGPVNMDSFAADLEVLYRGFSDIDPATFAASEDAPEITELLLNLVRISEKNGLKLPREFGLLVKQQLYFTKYNAILAPTLDPLRDSRLAMKEMSRGTDGGPPQLAEVDAATIAGIGA